MPEVGAIQAERTVVLEAQQISVEQLAPAFGALCFAPHHEDHNVFVVGFGIIRFIRFHRDAFSKRAVVGNAQQFFHRPQRPIAIRIGLRQEIPDGYGVLSPRGGERRR